MRRKINTSVHGYSKQSFPGTATCTAINFYILQLLSPLKFSLSNQKTPRLLTAFEKIQIQDIFFLMVVALPFTGKTTIILHNMAFSFKDALSKYQHGLHNSV